MNEFRILIYEDDPEWVRSFKFNLSTQLNAVGKRLKVLHKFDGDTLMQDIEFLPQIILIDYDLGNITGEDIIVQIEGDPQFDRTSIVLYSGGESIQSLKEKAAKYECSIICHSKHGESLERFILTKV